MVNSVSLDISQMLVRTIFELQSIKDQLALIDALLSHINLEEVEGKEVDPDYRTLLMKMDKLAKNLREKYKEIKDTLDN